MTRALAIMLIVAVVGCCPCKHAGVTTSTSVQDSVYVTRYDTVREVRRDTLWYARLEQSSDRREVYAQHSELTNAYCISTADIADDGRLTHSLTTRDSAMLPIRIREIEHVVHDTIYRYRADAEAKTITKTVPRTRTWWHTTKDMLLLGLVCLALWQNRKLFLRLFGVWKI